jgi:probable F420-dependent oxidoreductase
MQRYGMTVPFDRFPLHEQQPLIQELARLGYTDLWSGEAMATDGFTPLVQGAIWAPALRLGSAVVPVYTRGPATLAMCAASLADAAPGRVVIGLGSSSNVIVERFNAIPFDRPYQRVRDTLRFLRSALAGERVDAEYETFSVQGFRLGRVPQIAPKLMIAALRPGMLKLAGREADGAILNWLSAEDVKRVVPYVHAGGPDREIVARVFVCPVEDTKVARQTARRLIAAYLSVPVYAEFHRWLGRGDAMADFWKRWDAGDRSGSLDAIPDQVVDDLVIHGSPETCRAHILRYVQEGVHTPVIQLIRADGDLRELLARLAPPR